MALQPIKAQRIGIPETTPSSRYPLGLHAEHAISNVPFKVRVQFDDVSCGHNQPGKGKTPSSGMHSELAHTAEIVSHP